MTDNEQFIYDSIYAQVRMGFLSIDAIRGNIIGEIRDNDFEDEIPKEWAFEQISKEWERLESESKQWKSPTDTEKLIQAFDALCKANIIALHNAGYTTSDGEEEVVEVEIALRVRGIVSDGYCFYHAQDLSRAIDPENPSLYIAFQKIDNSDDKVTVEVGKRVADTLRKHNLEVEWNETATTKILLPNFKWQFAYSLKNRRLLDYYGAVVSLMTN